MANQYTPQKQYEYKGVKRGIKYLQQLPECSISYPTLASRLSRLTLKGISIEQCVTMSKEAMAAASLEARIAKGYQRGYKPKGRPKRKNVDTSVGDLWGVPK